MLHCEDVNDSVRAVDGTSHTAGAQLTSTCMSCADRHTKGPGFRGTQSVTAQSVTLGLQSLQFWVSPGTSELSVSLTWFYDAAELSEKSGKLIPNSAVVSE